MKNIFAGLPVLLVSLFLLTSCSNPKKTVIPKDPNKFETIKTSINKLTPKEREQMERYLASHTTKQGTNILGMDITTGNEVPEGMTIEKALEVQTKIDVMRDAITVTLEAKKHQRRSEYGISMEENLVATFKFKNNTAKDISAAQGKVRIGDLFGSELISIENPITSTIKAGQTATWSGAIDCNFRKEQLRKILELTNDKLKVTLEPKAIIFSDGTKLEI